MKVKGIPTCLLICLTLLTTTVACTQSPQQTDNQASMELIEAAQNNDTVQLRTLLQTDANIDATDDHGRTALLVATYAHHAEAALLLLRAGADVNAQDDRLESPFLHAGASGYLDILRACLATGEVDYMVLNRYGGTALIPACERGHTEVVKELLAIDDFPIDHVNRLGWTALMEAIVLGNGGQTHTHIVELLVDAGSNVNIPDKDGITPLQHARNKGFTNIADILKAAGAR